MFGVEATEMMSVTEIVNAQAKPFDRRRCPGCDHARGNKPDAKGVYHCQGCGGIFHTSGTLYLGDSYAYVLPYWDAPGACATEDQRYYDLTVLGSEGVTRRHGWYNPKTKRITQVG
jgi:ribosomal protein L37AE/L43A